MGQTETSAGYNFVPLSKKVVFPEWGPQVSQDIPFKDGISGTIECELEATSPIYVRNGGTGDEVDTSFFNVDDKVMIPGSSLKGLLRNVIEIASFGKMKPINDKRHAFRDLNNANLYRDRLQGKTEAGWLNYDSSRHCWYLTPCKYAKVSIDALDFAYLDNNGLKKCKSIRDKYLLWAENGAPTKVAFNIEPTKADKRHAVLAEDGDYVGTPVLTGNTDPKKKDFLFYAEQANAFDVSQELIDEFIFAHTDRGEPTEAWEYWQGEAKKDKQVPIFFVGKAENPDSLGLCSMYRLPYAQSAADAIAEMRKGADSDSRLDLAECMFGYVSGEGNGALKGRVQIGHALAFDYDSDERVSTVLGGPKPTYYPNYLEQPKIFEGRGEYKTLMDKEAAIRGWKRYPARTVLQPFPPPNEKNEKVNTSFTPLKKGARFSFKIRVHNLKAEEFGALIWALELGGNSDLRHGLGMGKAFGRGQVKIQIKAQYLRTVTGINRDPLGAQQFIGWMEREVPFWLETEQLFQLMGMADPEALDGSRQQRRFKQMDLDQHRLAKGSNEKNKERPMLKLPAHKSYAKVEKQLVQKKLVFEERKERLARLRSIKLWSDFRELMSDKKLKLYLNEPEFVEAAKTAVLRVRKNQKKNWSDERDQLITDWLGPFGINWQQDLDFLEKKHISNSDSEISLSAEEQAQVDEINVLTQFSPNFDLERYCRAARLVLRDRYKAWGCNKRNAKRNKKEAWEALSQSLEDK